MLNPASVVSARLPTAADVRAAIHMAYHPLSRSSIIGQRCLLLDTRLQPVTLAAPPNPAVPNDVSAWMEAITITNNVQQDVHRTCALKLTEMPQLQLDTLRHRIQVNVLFYDEHRDAMLEVPKGIFRFIWPDREAMAAKSVWALAGADLSSRLSKKFFSPFTFPAGTTFTDAATGLLLADIAPPSEGGRPSGGGPWPFGNHPGLTPGGCKHAGINWDPSMLDVVPSGLALPADQRFDYKDNQLAVLKTNILQPANYWPFWVNSYGRGQISPMPYQYVDADGVLLLPQPDWSYISAEGGDYPTIFKGSLKQRVGDGTQPVNAVQVIAQNPQSRAIRVDLWNHNPSSALSLENYQDSYPETIEDPNIPDEATARIRAYVELVNYATAYSTIDFTTAINPLHESHDFLSIDWTTNNGGTRIGAGALFEELAWTIDFQALEMTHTARALLAV